MELGAIFSGLKTIVGVLIPPIRKKFFDQPKIYFVFQFNSSSQSSLGISIKNDIQQPIAVPYVIYDYHLMWEYDLYLRNNSEHTAYNIKIINPKISNVFSLNPKIDFFKPLVASGDIRYLAKFFEEFTGTISEAEARIKEKPPLQKEFILEYTNLKGTKFYTHFDFNAEEEKKNQFKSARLTWKKIIGLSAIIAIISFTIILISNIYAVSNYLEDKKPNEEILLKQDAHIVSESIVISGWEDPGDYVGYLSQITGFYFRHKNQFPTEYEIYKKQLDHWTNYLNGKSGNYLYSNDTEGLKGLVTSGKQHLQQLEK